MPEVTATQFTIDSIPGARYSGYTDGTEWNGFARPLFTYETALQVLHDSEPNGFRWTYVEAEDAFQVESDFQPDDEPDVFAGMAVSVNGIQIRVYPIGSGSWIWSEADED